MAINTLRIAAITEGISFVLLLAIAMPLKYFVGIPEPVKVMGWIHGILFISLCALVIRALNDEHISLRLAALIFVAALLPFGPFVIDRKLRASRPS
jgi:integral membrane protein